MRSTVPDGSTILSSTPEDAPQGPPRHTPQNTPPNPHQATPVESPWFTQPVERTSNAHSVLPPAETPALPAKPPALPAKPRRRGSAAAIATAAFVLGGAVGAGGFALGQSVDSNSAGTEAAPIVNVTTPATTPDVAPTTVPLAAEPAAVVATILGPSVVQVETDRGQGSGVVYADGLILTNHHVISGANQVRIRTSDGRVIDTELLGSDPRNDIAVLSAPGSNLPVATVGSSADLQVGQLTVAIGSPFQLQQTVTAGIVSSVNRPVPNNGGGLSAMIQTDAPINPGNSGGALANRAGELVGINTSIRTDGTSNSNVGIGFAVPIDTATAVAERIVSGQSLEPGVLGVSGENDDSTVGVPIAEVVEGSGAEAAGLVVGDRIVTIDGAPVTSIGEVVGLIQSQFSGETVELDIIRGSQELTVEATLR